MVADISGLAVIGISDPLNPVNLSYTGVAGMAAGIDVHGSHAFVAAESAGLAIIDISDPIHPGTPVYAPTSGVARRDGMYLLRVDVMAALVDQNRCPGGKFGCHRRLQGLVAGRRARHRGVAVDVDVGIKEHVTHLLDCFAGKIDDQRSGEGRGFYNAR